ncbi:TPA: hypothetical protein ACGW3M_000979 [Pseudomonas aeruginosa]|nr:hypothetical protein [Pseudomonas aeruginosa]ELJ2276203.1 hypothetical protein [Pseudomonas aeruginosa]MBX6653722.1 hypothetical protein [Pseudomonas aeruginosa]
MIAPEVLRKAVDALQHFRGSSATRLTEVDWRDGHQIKVSWYGNDSLACYLDFGKDRAKRRAVMAACYRLFGGFDREPEVLPRSGGVVDADFTTLSREFISINEVADLAASMGGQFSVLYVQDCNRSVFDLLGMQLQPGELGVEWLNGQFIPYTCQPGKCL